MYIDDRWSSNPNFTNWISLIYSSEKKKKRKTSCFCLISWYLPEYLSSLPVFSRVRVTRSLVLCVCYVDHCLSFWSLCCLFFVDVRILINPLVSSNSSYLTFDTSIISDKRDHFNFSITKFLYLDSNISNW